MSGFIVVSMLEIWKRYGCSCGAIIIIIGSGAGYPNSNSELDCLHIT